MSEEYVKKEVWDAQLDTLIIMNEDTNRRIDDLRDSMNRHFTILSVLFGAIQIGLAIVLHFLK